MQIVDDQSVSSSVDLSELDPQALSERDEFRALAALARHYPNPQSGDGALRTIAGRCGDPEAFAWFWAIVTEEGTTEQRWALAVQSLPDSLHIPEQLRSAVTDFVVRGEGKEGPHGESARQLILERVDTSFAQQLAREIVASQDAPPSGDLETAVLKVLCRSPEVNDRASALDRISPMPAPHRFEALGYVTTPYKRGEQEKIAKLVGDALADGLTGQGSPIIKAAAKVIGRFTPKTIADVLADGRWPGNTRDQVLRHGLIASISASDRIGKIIDQGSLLQNSDVATEVLNAAAALLSVPNLAALAEEHHGSYPSAVFNEVRAKLRERIDERGDDRGGLTMSYWRIAVSARDTAPADELAGLIDTGELGKAKALKLKDTDWGRVGRVARIAVNRDTDGFQAEAAVLGDKLAKHTDLHTDYVTQLSLGLDNPQSLDDTLVRHFALSEADVKALCDEELYEAASVGAAAIARQDGSSRAAIDLFSLADPEEVDFDGLRQLITWAEGAEYRRYILEASKRPDILSYEVNRAMSSLSDVAANQIPAELMEFLLTTAVQAGFKEVPSDHVALRELLHHRRRTLAEITARWVEESGDTSSQTVKVVIEADRDTDHEIASVVELRKAMGLRLTERAADPTANNEERVGALQLAARVDQAQARATAFVLADDDSTALREGAANVLVGTTAALGDDGKLSSLIEKETIAPIKAAFERALRAIKAGTVGDALHSLLVFLDLGADHPSPTIKTVLPDSSWHKGFISDVNGLLDGARTPDSPKSFLTSACNLADTLAEQALVARFDANPGDVKLKADQAKSIRENHPKKADIGALARNQQNQTKFPWFSQYLSLRQYRPAHTAPAGDTEPLELGEREYNKARSFLQDIVDGWIGSMYETYAMT